MVKVFYISEFHREMEITLSHVHSRFQDHTKYKMRLLIFYCGSPHTRLTRQLWRLTLHLKGVPGDFCLHYYYDGKNLQQITKFCLNLNSKFCRTLFRRSHIKKQVCFTVFNRNNIAEVGRYIQIMILIILKC